MRTELKHGDITKRAIGAAFDVYNELGFGFVEKVYENSMVVELQRAGIAVRQQDPIKVFYREVLVGDYIADLIVEDKVLIELKAVANLDPCHEVQLVNYLKATGIPVGLLMNFGRKFEFKRRVFDRNRTVQSSNSTDGTMFSHDNPLDPCRSASALPLDPRRSASSSFLNPRESASNPKQH
jgi:GxxExxY protein